ncbi:MAG: glycogen debranching enzyme N-terminal domain-containing protein, partial [Lachnospiraceae bacterium]|nr:glycogen debranching enzyme N-terminal domain-containing protein [Lachnospiraceae bacterium]
MRFLYGKQDWKTFERGEENCYLMTNGLGGFSSLSIIGSCSRNDQAVLMTCTYSPNHRYNMIHRMEECLEVGQMKVHLSSQDYQSHSKREEGYLYQTGFSFEDYPVWTYLVGGVEVTRTIVLRQGHNTLGIAYRIKNRSKERAVLTVRPHLQFVPKGERLSSGQLFAVEKHKISSNGQSLTFRTNGRTEILQPIFCDTLYYADDVADGKMTLGRSLVNHEISFAVEAGVEDTFEIIYSTENLCDETSFHGSGIKD